MRIEVDTKYSPTETVKYWHYNSETGEQWAEGVIESIHIRLDDYDYVHNKKPRSFFRIYDGSIDGVDLIERSDGLLIDYSSLYGCPLSDDDIELEIKSSGGI